MSRLKITIHDTENGQKRTYGMRVPEGYFGGLDADARGAAWVRNLERLVEEIRTQAREGFL